jgi:fucose permease
MKMIAWALLLAGISIGGMVSFQESRLMLWWGTGLLGLAVAPIFPQLLLVADARLHLRGSTTRWFFVGASAGSITIPWTLGQAFQFIGPQILMPAMVAVLLGNVTCYLLLLKRLKSPGQKTRPRTAGSP